MAYLSEPVRVGDVLGDTFGFLRAQWRPLLLISAPSLLAAVALAVVQKSLGLQEKPELVFTSITGSLASSVSLITLAIAHLCFVGTLFFTLERQRGHQTGVAEALRMGVRLFLPMLGVRFLVYFLSIMAAVLLYVPGLMVYTMLWVADAAYVAERPGIRAALSRSRNLTRGSRWRVFLLMLMVFVAAALASGLQTAAQRISEWAGPFTSVFAGMLWAILVPVLAATLYRHLKTAREGDEAADIAAVF
ncbi:hypothetical protein FJQ54_03575 [Sandaracinobacter neustonicus]|uniref:Glycerophosphoryl diester phosphodiesterase membrane domain-containing protein n=1 Tax=Sandaracinobacter neustonicus TaxID=1715348 RepID=A0A501XT35_9SPHN|nr:hypothetical protein [Sandaracinobacter neustonicus]TPE63932.1 hypothetical protein FJQ54_03575 [Sandaracinobacter neustonicus]